MAALKTNYIDEQGNYHNNLNLTLTQIYDSGVELGSSVAKENYIKDLEKLRDDVVVKLCLGKECDRCLFEGAYGICGVKNFIAERISELKGESKC